MIYKHRINVVVWHSWFSKWKPYKEKTNGDAVCLTSHKNICIFPYCRIVFHNFSGNMDPSWITANPTDSLPKTVSMYEPLGHNLMVTFKDVIFTNKKYCM